jgi:hypothetical protein
MLTRIPSFNVYKVHRRLSKTAKVRLLSYSQELSMHAGRVNALPGFAFMQREETAPHVCLNACTLYISGNLPFLFAYLQMKFLFDFVPPELLMYSSSYTQSIICI